VHDTGGKCLHLPSVGEFWVLLETNQTEPSSPFTTGVAANSKWLRVDEATGDYIAMADDSTAQPGKLFLWGPAVADEVNQLVIAAGHYFTTSGGTTLAGNCMVAWNFDGSIAWEQFWASDPSGYEYGLISHIIYNATLGALYCTRPSPIHPYTQLQSINLATGARATITTYWRSLGNYRPAMDLDGYVWLGAGASPWYEERHDLTVPSYTTIENVGNVVGRQMYDEANDVAYWYAFSFDEIRYWDGAAVVDLSAPSGVYFAAAGGEGVSNNVYEQFRSNTGYWTATREAAAPRDLYFLDLVTFATVKQVTEPADTYATEYAASGLKYQFAVSYTRAWWRIKQTTWKFLIWTEGATRRRVSVCVIT